MKITEYEANVVNIVSHLVKCCGDIQLTTSKLVDLMVIDNREYNENIYKAILEHSVQLSNILVNVSSRLMEFSNLNVATLYSIMLEEILKYKEEILQKNDFIRKHVIDLIINYISSCIPIRHVSLVNTINELRLCIINSLKLYIYIMRSISTIENGNMVLYLNGSLLNYSTLEELVQIVSEIISLYNLTSIDVMISNSYTLSSELLELFVISTTKKNPSCEITYY